MQLEDLLAKFREFLLEHIRNANWRGRINRFGDRLLKMIGMVTLISGIVAFAATGAEFFTKTIPNISAFASRTFLLAGTFRSILAEHIVRADLGL